MTSTSEDPHRTARETGDQKAEEESTFATDLFRDYSEYAKILRGWFVAYGIGGPVLLLTNESIRKSVVSSGQSRVIASLFVLGVMSQVLLALVNKSSLWLYYRSTRHPALAGRRIYRVARWFAYEFWIEFSLDAISTAALGIATYEAFAILT